MARILKYLQDKSHILYNKLIGSPQVDQERER